MNLECSRNSRVRFFVTTNVTFINFIHRPPVVMDTQAPTPSDDLPPPVGLLVFDGPLFFLGRG